jgi:hypothetical protein
VADFDKVIPPGQEGRIDVTIHGNKVSPGHVEKNWTVTTNDPENEKVSLTLVGNIVKVFDISAEIAASGFSNEDLKQEVILTNQLDQPIQITGYRWSDQMQSSQDMADKIGVKIETIEKGRQYRLKVWNKQKLQPGHYLGDLYLTTNFDKLKEKKVMVRFTITPDVEVHPETIHMREMVVQEGTSQNFEKKITVIAARADTLKILKIVPDRDDITTNVQEVVPGKSYRCTVSIRPPTETGRYLGTLRIYTNYPGYEQLAVNITGTVRAMKPEQKE